MALPSPVEPPVTKQNYFVVALAWEIGRQRDATLRRTDLSLWVVTCLKEWHDGVGCQDRK